MKKLALMTVAMMAVVMVSCIDKTKGTENGGDTLKPEAIEVVDSQKVGAPAPEGEAAPAAAETAPAAAEGDSVAK